ncbi:MAG TPA: hypothetical protein VEF76_07690 [Patescibacteria group bacterium]|nr:hypothetical protein [Patescibacteria group bacterium]
MTSIIEQTKKTAAPILRLVQPLLSSVGDDKTSYKGNQSSQVISFSSSQQ